MTTVGVFLQTNQTKTVQVNTTTPPLSGTYYLYACISTLDDEDTENNCAQTTLVVQVEEVTEEPAAQPDLTVGFALSPPRTVAPNAVITFYARVRNIGDADATTSRIRLFRHTERTTTPRIGGTEVATLPLSPAPRAGRGVIRSLRGRVPATPGTYYFSLCVDQTEGEIDLTNNCTSQPRPVIVQGATEETPEEPETPDTDHRILHYERHRNSQHTAVHLPSHHYCNHYKHRNCQRTIHDHHLPTHQHNSNTTRWRNTGTEHCNHRYTCTKRFRHRYQHPHRTEREPNHHLLLLRLCRHLLLCRPCHCHRPRKTGRSRTTV